MVDSKFNSLIQNTKFALEIMNMFAWL